MSRFGRIGLTRPEQFPKTFNVYRYVTETNERGRERDNTRTLITTEKCILSIAKAEERQYYHQFSVKITHTIIQRGAPVAKENDEFVLVKNGAETRTFRVQAVHNKGEMDIHTVYYCEERSDRS